MKLFKRIKSIFKYHNPLATYKIGYNIIGDDESSKVKPIISVGLLNPDFVKAGQVVNFRIIIPEDYELISVSVRNAYNGNKISYIPTYECNYEYSFKMPHHNVNINVKVEKKGFVFNYGK